MPFSGLTERHYVFLLPLSRAGSEVRRRHLEHVAITVKKRRKPGQRGHADGKGREQNQAQKRNGQKPCHSSLPFIGTA